MNQYSEKERNIARTVKAARDLFAEQGIEKTTIKQIARAANLSEMSIYRYFTNKEILVAKVWERSLDDFYGQFLMDYKSQISTDNSGYDKLKIALNLLLEMYSRHPESLFYTRKMVSWANNLGPENTEEIERFWNQFYQGIPKHLKNAYWEGIEDGSITPKFHYLTVWQVLGNIYAGTGLRFPDDWLADPVQQFENLVDLLIELLKNESSG